jgi:hypothetical protein
MKITTIGIDLAKEVFRFTVSTSMARLCCASSFGGCGNRFFCQFKEALNKCHFEQEYQVLGTCSARNVVEFHHILARNTFRIIR